MKTAYTLMIEMRSRDPKKYSDILNYLNKVKCDTTYGIGKEIGCRPYTAKIYLDELVKKGKVFCKKVLENNRVKIYYSTSRDLLPVSNEIPPSPRHNSIPRYYAFLDELFGRILSSEDAPILLNHISELGMSIDDIIEMQKELNQGDEEE